MGGNCRNSRVRTRLIVKPQGASIDGGMKEGEGARAVGLSVGFLFLLLVVVVVV